MEYERLRHERYLVPVVFQVGADRAEQQRVDEAVSKVFDAYFRTVRFQRESGKKKRVFGQSELREEAEWLGRCMEHERLRWFMRSDREAMAGRNEFATETWCNLLSCDSGRMRELVKL